MLKLSSLEEYDGLETSMGIRQHPANCQPTASGQADVIIMTGVAFSEQGHRLGHGRGWQNHILKLLKIKHKDLMYFQVTTMYFCTTTKPNMQSYPN